MKQFFFFLLIKSESISNFDFNHIILYKVIFVLVVSFKYVAHQTACEELNKNIKGMCDKYNVYQPYVNRALVHLS